MHSPRATLAIAVAICCVLALQPAEAQKPSALHKRAPASSAIASAPDAQPLDPEIVPIPSMDPEELVPSAPKVSYRKGQLTIDANNATLRDVLIAITKATGAVIDVPAESASERVVLHLSGAPSAVLPEVLNGSAYGYILRSSTEDPVGIREVVLTKKATASQSPLRASSADGPQHAKPRDRAAEYRATTSPPLAPPTSESSSESTPASGTDSASTVSSQAPTQLAAEAIPIEDAADSSAQTLRAAVDPHPTPPVQVPDAQNPEQRQKQTETNRQFMQDMYSARQKLQTQPQ